MRTRFSEIKAALDLTEFTICFKVTAESSFKAVLNEKPPSPATLVTLPEAHAARIIPSDIFPHRRHPDVRLARRASTIAALARVISERKVAKGLRTTLLTQAQRLEKLSRERLADFAGTPDEEGEDVARELSGE